MLAKNLLIAKPLVYLGELATRYFKQQVSLWVAQQLLWVKQLEFVLVLVLVLENA